MGNLDQYSRRPGKESAGGRNVPLTTALAVLFGGFFLQFGAGFFAFGMIFWWVFGAQSDVTSWYRFSGNLQRIWGTALACEHTGISEGGGDSDPGTPIYRTTYHFELPQGTAFEGVCYGTGMYFQPGGPVEVEFLAENPEVSRIVGTRKAAIGAWGIFVGLFPGLGLLFMGLGLRGNLRAVRVLKRGKLTRGKLVDKQPTNTRINNRMVYRFTFEFQDEHGRIYRVSGKTHHTELLEDEEQERLLYDPEHPDGGVLVDTLPGKPELSPDGDLRGANPGAVLLRMLLPVGGLAVHAAVGVALYLL
ncbi:MAG: DUF3592 domain-containing protein [Planctomycetes bacterium]|nr:DUF3592 domain-containing protein [Planctomycetota bacterium]